MNPPENQARWDAASDFWDDMKLATANMRRDMATYNGGMTLDFVVKLSSSGSRLH